MQFVVRRRSRPVIPLVSLIDILTILLIFFIVTTRFREREEMDKAREERRLEINLPGIAAMEGAPAEGERLRISLTADGKILLGGETLPSLEALATALAARIAADPTAAFELEPDESAPLGLVIGVWDALAKAGIPINQVPARVLKR